jgi:hypothetical protein
MPHLVWGKDGIQYAGEECREIYERTSQRLGMSVIEISRFVWEEMLMSGRDQRIEMYKRTRFQEVPAPSDEVDLDECWARMREDDRNCELIMMSKPSIADVLRVMAQQMAWLRFAAERWPTAEGRKAFYHLEQLQYVVFKSLIAKGEGKRDSEGVTEALEALVEMIP